MRTLRFALAAAALAALTTALPTHAAPALANPVAGVDVMTATVLQEGQSSFSGMAIRLRLRSAELVENVQIMPTVEYWRNSSTIETFGIQSVRKDATLGVDARWTFPREGWKPYLGAGLAAHFLSNEVNAPSLGLPNASDSVIKGGLAALAGVDFPMNTRLTNFIELKFHGVGGYNQLKINWGLAWGF